MLAKLTLFLVFISVANSWTVDINSVAVEGDGDKEKSESVEVYSYAKDFGYHNFKEEKINSTSIISDGSAYLEGLSRALMAYRDTLGNCSHENRTSSGNENSKESESKECQTATKNSEYVQRLSDLALVTTNKLRDKAYDNKNMNQDDPKIENELLLQLAWFLDRLAQATGYEPNPKEFIEKKTEIETPQNTKVEINKRSSMELLDQVENNRPLSKRPPKTTSKSTSSSAVKSVRKRSTNDPMDEVLGFYMKYKIWDGANPTEPNTRSNSGLDPENHLKTKNVSKRSIKNVLILPTPRIDFDEKNKKLVKMTNYLQIKTKAIVSKPFNNKKKNL